MALVASQQWWQQGVCIFYMSTILTLYHLNLKLSKKIDGSIKKNLYFNMHTFWFLYTLRLDSYC